MNLEQWRAAYPAAYVDNVAGCLVVGDGVSRGFHFPGWADLFHLSDYLVSSVSCGQAWLVARPRPAEGGDDVGD